MAEDALVVHQTISFKCVPCSKRLGVRVQMEAVGMGLEGSDGFITCPKCGAEVQLTFDTYFMA
jgi:DNA-directed RNA polymerase subunit RPC12/RpoP